MRYGHLVCRAGLALAVTMISAGVLRAEDAAPDPAVPAAVVADVPADALVPEGEAAPQPLSDLTLANFFTEGWNQPWAKRKRFTPDMALLRVTTNFLEREFRFDYVRTNVANSATLDSTDMINGLIAYGLNRRLMLEVVSNYQWNNLISGDTKSGAGGGFLTRFQLVDTDTASYAFQARISPANKGIGQTQTSLQFAVAGWQDMHAVVPALGRFGLYYSFQYENLLGSHAPGVMENDISYAVSFAETWTQPTTPVFGNFTTFVEFFGQSILDGANSGKTNITITPGFRFWFIPENSITFGVDLPISSPRTIHSVVRVTYIMNF
ncbi:MAG TPA: hypothetical protein VKG23_09500 [Thermoanaerobaculia bacterium]|nr:hypothetical protein [Thermoanaerobaculia bacterium]